MHRLRVMAANARAGEKLSAQPDRSRFRSGPMRVKARGTAEGEPGADSSELLQLLREVTQRFRETSCLHEGEGEAPTTAGRFRSPGAPALELAASSEQQSPRCPHCDAFRLSDDCPVDVRLTVAVLRQAVRLLKQLEDGEDEL